MAPLLLALALSSQLDVQELPLRAYHGRERTVRKMRLRVPADHGHPNGRTLEIAAYVFPAKAAASAPPIIFLMGGPGIPGTVLAPIPPYFDLFDRLSENADVVVLDQRGLGESVPKVDCPPPVSVSRSLFESKAKLLAAFQALNEACAAHWRKQSIEPTDFAIEQVADDVESLRVALGAKQVDLLAFSYGTRIATEVLRRHPGSVRRVVLQGVLARTIRLPASDDQTFRAVAALAHAQSDAKRFDADIERSLRALQQRLGRLPLELTIRSVKGPELRVRVARDVFDGLVATRLGDRRLPAMLTNANRGDTTILAQWFEGLFQDLEKGGAPLMRAAIVCSAAEDRAAVEAASRQAPRSLLGDPFDNLQQGEAYCRGLGFAKRPPSNAAWRVAAPALLISGTLDDRTPVAGAEALRTHFAASEHLIVTNGGHELLPERRVQDVVVAFLRGQPPPVTTIELEPPDLPDVDAAKTPPRRPQ